MTRAHWILLAIFLLLLSLVMPKGCASKVFKWVDEQGITHYSDKKPAHAAQQRVSELPIKTPPPEDTRREVTLRNTGSKRHPELRVRNPFHGPVNIRLKLIQAKNIVTEPPLPDGVLDTVVPARYDGVVLYISPDNPRQGRMQADLLLEQGELTFRRPVLGLDRLPFGRIGTSVVMDRGKVRLEKGRVESRLLRGDFHGSLVPGRDLAASAIRVQGTVRPRPELFVRLGSNTMSRLVRSRLKKGALAFTVSGTLAEPGILFPALAGAMGRNLPGEER